MARNLGEPSGNGQRATPQRASGRRPARYIHQRAYLEATCHPLDVPRKPLDVMTAKPLHRGRPPELRKAMRNLALVVREGVPSEIMRDFHLMIAMGQSPLVVRASNGDLKVQAEEGGMAPTLDQRVSAMKFLTERGYGLPAQTINLEAELRAQIASTSESLPVGQLSPAAMRAIREAIRARPVLDAVSVERVTPAASAELPPELGEGDADTASAEDE